MGMNGAKVMGEITVSVTGITAELKVEVEPANKNEYTPVLAVFEVYILTTGLVKLTS
jgi:hypothetical protein